MTVRFQKEDQQIIAFEGNKVYMLHQDHTKCSFLTLQQVVRIVTTGPFKWLIK